MLRLYEQMNLTVDEKLMGQYLQHPPTTKQFAIYYDLWLKYRSDYQVDAILDGEAPAAILDRAKAAKFDERMACIREEADWQRICGAQGREGYRGSRIRGMLQAE